MSDLLQKLQWRYATKKMNPAKAVPQEKVDRILEAARLAPTSSGLQPYEILVVTNKEIREQIKPKAWGQGPGAGHRLFAPAGIRRLGHLHARAHQPHV